MISFTSEDEEHARSIPWHPSTSELQMLY